MDYIWHASENVRTNDRFNGNEKMTVDITSSIRNVGLLHFPKMIVLNPCFHNYMKRLPHQPLTSIL